MSWERIMNDLNNVLGAIEDISLYSRVIPYDIEEHFDKRLKSIIQRLNRKKRKSKRYQSYQKDLEKWR